MSAPVEVPIRACAVCGWSFKPARSYYECCRECWETLGAALPAAEADRLREIVDDRLGSEERQRRVRQSQRVRQALANPAPLVNRGGAFDAHKDATTRPAQSAWEAVALATNRAHAVAIHEVEHPSPPAPVRPLRKSTSVARRDRYALAALEGEAREIAGTPAGNRNNVLVRSAFRIGQLVGDGLVDTTQAEQVLLDAAREAGLPDRDAASTIRSGLRAGALHPRKVAS